MIHKSVQNHAALRRLQTRFSIVGAFQSRQSTSQNADKVEHARFWRGTVVGLVSGLFSLVMGGCGGPIPATMLPETVASVATESAPIPATAEEAIPWLILAERRAAGTGDLALLAQLWAEDATVIEQRGEDAAQFYRWEGKAAVLSRYRVAVFPHAPPPLSEADLVGLRFVDSLPQAATEPAEGQQVVVENGTDQWTFVYRGGQWRILRLNYEL